MNKIIAIVVTYNRQHLLSQCIAALQAQTKKIDKILVINNGSTDNTEGWLRTKSGIDFITQENVGGAGGFCKGLKAGYEQGFSWMWLMDDDGFPKKDALEKLLEGSDEELCLRNCAVLNKDDKESFVWKTKNYSSISEVKDVIIKNVAHPFNGTLLHRKVVDCVGFPNASLFLWGDETEYYYRIIRKYKIPFYTKADSIHYHPASAYSYKNDWDFCSNWKMYYYVRNRYFILKSKFSKSILIAFAMYICFAIAFAGTIIIFQKTNKIRKLRFILWPMADAFTNNYKATPALIVKRISAPPLYTSYHYLLHQVRVLAGIDSQVSKLKKA